MIFDRNIIPFIFVGIAGLTFYSCINTRWPPMSHVQSNLMMQAYEIKKNDKRDKLLIVTDVAVTTRLYDGQPCFWVDYVDECELLAQINYSPSTKDSDDLGRSFLLLQDVSPPRIIGDPVNQARSGSLNIFVILEPRDDFPGDAATYIRRKGKDHHLVLPEMVCNAMVELRGQFIFLDKNGNVLDKFELVQE